MAAAWKTVRVFISSTFRDMHAERDHLVKVVFPALRERLEKHRIHLVDIDLRWGVTREQAENDQALDLCLQQIDECRPFFIGILGERYGWVPTRYPVEALKRFGWIQHQTGKSVTELEILHGVLLDSKMRGRAFFYFRDAGALQKVPEAVRLDVYADSDPECIQKLKDLKQKIRSSDYPVMENYPARWDAEAYDRPSRPKGRLVDLDEFGNRVHDQLWQSMLDEYQLVELSTAVASADPLAEEQDYHERFMESRLRVYVGREQINDGLLAFADGNDLVPCLVTGPSGSGKSAALARFVQSFARSQIANQESQILIVPHFIGASPRSTNLRDMLKRFCQVLKARFSFAEDVPEEVAKLSVTFREFVRKVPADARVLIVIDALNQLDEADRGQEEYWLPGELPPQVKVIASCLAAQSQDGDLLTRVRRLATIEWRIEKLTFDDRYDIIKQVPLLSAKSLDTKQRGALLANPATENPLFLLVALEELRGFASYERLNERISTFPCEGDTVTAIFTQMIERLAEEFNPRLVEKVLTLLASAKRGLSERELQELTFPLATSGRGVGVEGVDGADDLFPVLRQLRPYLLSRAGLIDFYHRNLFKAVHEHYLPSEEQQRQAHGHLADYFNAQDYWLESLDDQRRRSMILAPTPRQANVRKVDELPWHLLQAADWQRSAQLLTDLAFLEAKAEAGLVFELAADFGAAGKAMPDELPWHRRLGLLGEALGLDLAFLARHPSALFQTLWNRCWWYDCPDAAMHYLRESAGSKAILQSLWCWLRPWRKNYRSRDRDRRPPWNASEPKLYELLEQWRERKEKAEPGFQWVRMLRPPSHHLGTALRKVLVGNNGWVTSLAVSPDGKRLVSGLRDNTVRLWDANTETELLRLYATGWENTLSTNWVNSVSFSMDGKRLALGLGDNTVRLFDAETGLELRRLQGHTCPVICVSFSVDGKRLASGSEDKTVRLWDVEKGVELSRFEGHMRDELVLGDHTFAVTEKGEMYRVGHTDGVTSVSFSVDGKLLGSGSRRGTVLLWDAETGQEVRRLVEHTDRVNSVSFSVDGKRLASGSRDQSVCLWDVERGVKLHRLEGHTCSVSSVTFSVDGKRLASGSYGKTVRLWDTETGVELRRLEGHSSSVISVSFCVDGKRLAAGSDDNTVRFWDVETGDELRRLKGHMGKVERLSFSVDGKRLASESQDNTVCLWNTETGAELHRLEGHSSRVTSVSVSVDGKHLALGLSDGTVRLCDAETGVALRRLEGHTKEVTSVSFSVDAKRLASGSEDKTVRLWNTETGVELHRLEGHSDRVTSVSFSLDGMRLASGSGDNTVRLWDTKTGVELHRLEGHIYPAWSVSFSAGGTCVASGSGDKTVRLWDTETGIELHRLEGHTGSVTSVSFSVDGKRLASGSNDKSVRLWDTETGVALHRLEGHTGSVTSVSFSVDGKCLASGAGDNTVRLWDAETGVELRRLEGHTGRVERLSFSVDGKRLAAGLRDGPVPLWDTETSECLEVFPGGRASFPAARAAKFRWRAVQGPLETVIQDSNTGEHVAWIAMCPRGIKTHPSGRIWAGHIADYVCLFALEGNASSKSGRTGTQP